MDVVVESLPDDEEPAEGGYELPARYNGDRDVRSVDELSTLEMDAIDRFGSAT